MKQKQTAVEWLIDQLRQLAHNQSTHLGMGDIRVTQGMLDDFEEQAKEMEKTMIKTILERYMEWDKVINNSKKIGKSKLLHRAEGAKGELGAILGQFGYSVNLDSSKAEEYLKNL